MLITCLGVQGSGKTVFLASLFDSIYSPAKAKHGFYLMDTCTNKTGNTVFSDNLLLDDLSLVKNLKRIGIGDFSGYPAGTRSSTLRRFSLVQNGESVLQSGWLDYKGGLISGESVEVNDQNELYSSLDISTAIIVYLDGYRIANSTSVEQAQLWVGAENISRILGHLESTKEDKITNILIVLTQCDAIEDKKWIGTGNYGPLKEKAKEVLGGVCSMINRNPLWNCGIVAVTAIGVGNNMRTIRKEARFNSAPEVHDEIINFPKPSNVVEAYYWLVGCEVARQRFEEKKNIKQKKIEIETEKGRVNAGIIAVAAVVKDKEEARLKSLGFLARVWQTTIANSDRENRVNAEARHAGENWTAQQRHIAEALKAQLFDANRNLTKFEGALQPLFDASNKAVTKL